jgi:hypothetical protein
MKKTLDLLAMLILTCSAIHAQTPVTAVYTHWVNATTSKTYSSTGATGNASSGFSGNTYTYKFGTAVTSTNNVYKLDSFTALGLNFHMQAQTQVKFQRVNNTDVTGLRKSLWFELNNAATINANGTAKLIPDYDDSLERIFTTGDILNIGIDNDFQNASSTNNNNIERVDHIITSGVKATDNTKAGFVVFDRGNSGGHDPFYIAAIKTLDASGNPASYYNAVSVVAGNYGSSVVGTFNYLIMRENPGDAGLLMMNNSTSQDRDGVFLRFTDLGVANNAVIYGYSLFSIDDIVSPATNMVNYANSTNFPTTSDLSSGGLDQVAVTGLWVTNASYVVLPDRIDNFSAAQAGDNVQLTWTLGNTDGIKELVVERSPDGKDFMPLTTMTSLSSGPQHTADNQPLPANYYRLKLIDMDNNVAAYSPVNAIDINSINTFVNLNAFPNPVVHGRLTLHAEGLKNEPYEVLIFDMGGRVLVRQQLAGASTLTKNLNLPDNQPFGAYTLLLTDSRGKKVFTKTIMIQ